MNNTGPHIVGTCTLDFSEMRLFIFQTEILQSINIMGRPILHRLSQRRTSGNGCNF